LVKENDIGTLVPRVGVVCCVLPFIGDLTWTKFEQHASRGATTGTTIKPENKRVFAWVSPRLEKPNVEMKIGFIIGYIKQ
jgi:hypothetical protein